MKNLFFIAFLLLFGFTQAQTVKFSEDFETLPLSVSSSGSSNWARTSMLQHSGTYSDSASITGTNDTTILTTNSFSTSSFSHVLLTFNHIAKLALFDGGYIEVSSNNGTNWTRLTASEYYGSGYFGLTGNHRFNSTSYNAIWDPINNTMTPQNSWWRGETFDLSYLIPNTTQAKIRFVLTGSNTTNYGWLIDDIKISVSNNELVPPTISLQSPYPQDTVLSTGPFDIMANVTDSSGVAAVKLIYTIAGVNDTIPMTFIGGSSYKATIPSQPYGTTVCWSIIALDSNSNQGQNPQGSCISFITQKDPNAPAAFAYDAAIHSIENPQKIVPSGTNQNVDVRIVNRGDSLMTKATIGWELDGVNQPTFTWTGSLSLDVSSPPLTLGTKNYTPGSHNIMVYAYNPNDSVDQNTSNDTIQMSFYACPSVLNGVYTLGGNNADFVDFADLMMTLVNCGMSGPTTIKVNPGTYNEQVMFPDSIIGIDSLNPLTIVSSTNNKSDVIITYAPSSSENYVVGFDSVSWINIKDISIKSIGSSSATAVLLNDYSSNITIDNCFIKSVYGNNYYTKAIRVEGGSIHDIVISNNKIDGGYYAISLYGTYSNRQNRITITNNEIFNFYRHGIDIHYTNSPIIKYNNIHRKYYNNNTSLNGIYIAYGTFLNIESNQIKLIPDAASYGIYVSSSNGVAGTEAIIANNMVSISGSSTSSSIYGIRINACSYLGIYYNSVGISAGSGTSTTAFYVSGTSSTNNVVKNNIFAHFNSGLAFYHSSGTFSNLDYNAYYTNGLVIMKWGGYSGTSVATSSGITGIRSASSMDTNSIVTKPYFYSATNLHSYGSSINGAGDVISMITTDFDGQLRSTSTPDIGADEFTISSIDAGALSIVSPIDVDTQANVVPLIVIIKNYGSAAFTSTNIKYSLNGASAINYTWTGNLASGQQDTVNLGNITLPSGDYTLSVYTVLSGDTLQTNDTTFSNKTALPLIEVEASNLINPADGCGKGSAEDVTVEITNNGVGYIYNGLSASFQVNGGTVYSENITDTLAPGASINYTFNQQADLTTGYQNSTFHFIVAVHHTADQTNQNDTSNFDIVSLANLHAPIVSDTTINYGDTVSLVAISNDPIVWYANDTSSVVVGSGSSYTTPHLFDTTTYYAQANAYNPPQTGVIGTSSSTFGPFDMTPYGASMANGKYQILYTAAELSAAGLTAGNIESIAFNVSSSFSAPSAGFEIKLANVLVSNLTNTFVSTSMTTVFSGTFIGVQGWNTHTFTTPFYWDGTSNLLIQICTSGNPYNAAPMYYTTTATTMLTGTQGMGVSCTSSSGIGKTKRPNIRIKKQGTAGCFSAKAPLTVNVPLPAIDATVSDIVSPIDNCGLVSTQVTIDIKNMGTDSIKGPFSATYKVGNATYITAEIINDTIAPGDTLRYTFNTLASLAPGANGTKYLITAKVNVSSDSYAPNNTLVSDSIFSKYTPANPIVSNQTINYGDTTVLTASANDSIYWYADSMGTQLIGVGSSFTTSPIYDTTSFFAQARKTINTTNYFVGTGTSTTSYSDPSPYGAGGYSGWGQRNQYIITAAELKALGMIQGPIYSISFDVTNVKNIPLKNYTIKMGNTTVSDLSGNYFESGLTTVYTSNAYTDQQSWNEHVLSTPFFWDGISNLIIETCFKNTSGVAYSYVHYTTTSFVSVGYSKGTASFSCSDSTINMVSYKRPNMRLNQEGLGLCKSDLMQLDVNVINYQTHDAALTSIVEPTGNISSCSSSDVKVVLRNYGLNNMTAATINWSENGITQTAYSWTGNLAKGATDTITIASAHNFMGGSTEIKAWVNLANDTMYTNDTAVSNTIVSMHGTYTINPVSGDYLSFTEAINDLNVAGICGAVVFNIDSGFYNEQVVLYPISGSSVQNTITFQSTLMDSSLVTLTHSTMQNNNYLFKIDGASYINIKHISMIANGSTYGNNIVLSSGAHNISIKNNKLVSTNTTSYSSAASAVYTKLEGVDSVNISNNNIINSYAGIYLEGSGTDSLNHYVITNNTFNGFNNYALKMRYVNGIEMTGNTLNSSTQGSSVYGVYIYKNKRLSISQNDFILESTGSAYGLYLSYCEGDASQNILISNNFVSINSGSGTKYGAYISSCLYLNLYYNSFNIVTGNASSKTINLSGGSHINIKNNSIATNVGYAFYSYSIPANTTLDYNNYYVDTTTSAYFVRWSSDLADLAALKSFDANNNQNCINVSPEYVSSSDLHSQQVNMYNTAIPITGITTDIDGDTRNTTTPSIGADEFTPPAIDLGIQSMPYPMESDCGYSSNDSIIIKIKNQGLNSLNFANLNASIHVYISGVVIDTINYTINSGILATGRDTLIKVSNNYNLSINGLYTFLADVDIAGDGNNQNDNLNLTQIISYPNINSFPFGEDFETGVNISLKGIDYFESSISVSNVAANNSSYGLHFQGGGYGSWSNKTSVDDVYNNNLAHTAIAKTCNVDATNISALSLQFDLRQTKYSSYSSNTSWFRVLLIDANNNTHYLKNTVGDSVFKPQTINLDPFVRHTFDLSSYVGQNFQISFEAVNKYSYGYGSFDGDNAFVDNIVLWTPSPIDVSTRSIISDTYHGKIGDAFTVKAAIMNMGTDTLYTIPLAYQVDNGTIVRDTAIGTFVPNATDTFTFTTTHSITLGMQNLCVFSEIPNDGDTSNDTVCRNLKGMKTFTVNYSNDFENSDDWFGEGSLNQWQKGTPTTTNINAAHSGQNAWVTMLSSNYQFGTEEYLYSPYIIIPSYVGAAELEFYMFMDVNVPNAYGKMEYSFDGIIWASYGYMGMPNSTNWYNQNMGGNHVWSKSNSGWQYTSIILDSLIFNTNTPFQLRFAFNTGSSNVTAEGWAIDDFSITVPPLAIDAGVKNIISPTTSTVTGDSVSVSIELKNYGSDTLTSIPVVYTIDGTIIGSETWTGTLLKDSIVNYTFNTKFSGPSADYKICSYSNLSSDMQLQNDTACTMIVSTAGKIDAGVSNVISPSGQSSIGKATQVSIRIRNYGTDPLSNIPVEYLINGISKASETYTGTIPAGDSADYTFSTTYTSGVGLYTVCATTNMIGDVNNANNQTCISVLGTSMENAEANVFSVSQNQPNPANSTTTIEFYLPKSGMLQFKIVNMLGAVVDQQELSYSTGQHKLIVNTNNFQDGVYYYSISFEGETKTFKMIIVR
jgi:hypothetical protein